MKKMSFHSTVALLLGAAGMYIYFSLLGVVSALSIMQGIGKWVFSLPKSLQASATLAHHGIEELIVSLTVFGTLGLFLGKLTSEKPVVLGIFQFLGAVVFYFTYHYLVLHGNFLWVDDVPVWSQLLPFFIWFLICPSATLVGRGLGKVPGPGLKE